MSRQGDAEPMDCARRPNPCGKPHPKCMGHRSSDPNTPCGGKRMKGQMVCHNHGGAAPQALAAAARRQTEAEVAELAKQFLDNPLAEPVEDAGDELRRLATRVNDAVDAIGARVNQLNDVRYTAAGAGTEQLRAEVEIWLRLIKQAESLLTGIERLGLAEKAIQVTADQGRMLAAVVVAIYDALEESKDLKPGRREFANQLAAEKFRAIEAGGSHG